MLNERAKWSEEREWTKVHLLLHRFPQTAVSPLRPDCNWSFHMGTTTVYVTFTQVWCRSRVTIWKLFAIIIVPVEKGALGGNSCGNFHLDTDVECGYNVHNAELNLWKIIFELLNKVKNERLKILDFVLQVHNVNKDKMVQNERSNLRWNGRTVLLQK